MTGLLNKSRGKVSVETPSVRKCSVSGLSPTDIRRVLTCCPLRVKSEGCGHLSILIVHMEDRVRTESGGS